LVVGLRAVCFDAVRIGAAPLLSKMHPVAEGGCIFKKQSLKDSTSCILFAERIERDVKVSLPLRDKRGRFVLLFNSCCIVLSFILAAFGVFGTKLAGVFQGSGGGSLHRSFYPPRSLLHTSRFSLGNSSSAILRGTFVVPAF
jgi:hypothetical protein